MLKSEAKGLALATDTVETINATQLDIAARVLTGKADCEFSQAVDVDAVADRPGMFKVSYKGQSYMMVPEETTTGAVRLFNRRTGMVWLQIPSKSMLLDGREGHRLVDRCTQSEQRAAVAAVNAAAAAVPLGCAKQVAPPASAASGMPQGMPCQVCIIRAYFSREGPHGCNRRRTRPDHAAQGDP